MPEYHIARFDQMTQAVDTYAAVEGSGDGGTPGAVRVPAGVTRIAAVRTCWGNSAPVAADSGVVVTLRLSGNGLKDGTQDLVIGATTTNLETTGAGGFAISQVDAQTLMLGIAVVPGNDINIQAAMRGVDVGTLELGVELVFV